MNHKDTITFVIVMTVILSLLLFIFNDNSGISVTECTLKSDDAGNYTLNYTLLVGRHFNKLNCQYVLYSDNDTILANNSTILDDVYVGTFPMDDVVEINNTLTPKKAQITVYVEITNTQEGINKTSMQKAYARSFDL